MFGNIIGNVVGGLTGKKVQVKGTVVLMQKNVLDFTDLAGNVIDGFFDILGQNVTFQLVSSTVGDNNNGNRGVVGEAATLQYLGHLPSVAAGESKFTVNFTWEDNKGIPGAFIVKNKHATQFFLKTLTIDDFPGHGRIHFVCNSWVYPAINYRNDRIFFANPTYLLKDTPAPLVPYRQDELRNLRGDDVSGELKEWDRVYRYAYYNDLGDPDQGKSRPVLGGTPEYPYPRRGRTGRAPTRTDPNSESRLFQLDLNIYVPRDERFGHLKQSDFLTYSLKAVATGLLPVLHSIFDFTPNEFDSFKDVLRLYEGGIPIPQIPILDQLRKTIPFEMIKEILRTENGQNLLKLPKPHVIQVDKEAWQTDEEFAREMIAGMNPMVIQRLEFFPPMSQLDPSKYGNQNSTITKAHVEKNLEGLTVDEAMRNHRIYILDYHDVLMPYVNRINSSTGNMIYATRTLLFLRDDSTLKPLAIELSVPHKDGEQFGAESAVFTPAHSGGVDESIWQLAKAYVAVNDAGVHQLISHWLNTHATLEPFIIATNRQLSVLHPINKLLVPHYRDTMNINALARQMLINAGGIIELVVFPGQYAMEMSSAVYKSWNFVEQALPYDLIKRGVAVLGGNKELELLIKDYPYAVDGLAIWGAIETWVGEYCAVYYPTDEAVQADPELQAWWKEVREVGHGDKKDEPWWPRMATVAELTHSCTTIIWIASALHAAVNFGQYAFGGYHPNRSTSSRRLMPLAGTAEYQELEKNYERAYLRTLSSQLLTILEVSIIEILSTHSSDEVYLGQRNAPEWTTDQKALAAFERFGAALKKVEGEITARNADPSLKNRSGKVQLPYNLLYPTGEVGITAKGIPNSISI